MMVSFTSWAKAADFLHKLWFWLSAEVLRRGYTMQHDVGRGLAAGSAAADLLTNATKIWSFCETLYE